MNKKFIKWLAAIAGALLIIIIALFVLWKNHTTTDMVTEKEQTTEVSSDKSSEEHFFEDELNVDVETEDTEGSSDQFSTESTEVSSLEDEAEQPEILLESIEITAIAPYTGPFVEDGSDDAVENILMITVKNNTPQTLQYAEATLLFDDTTARFRQLEPAEPVLMD